MKNLNSYNVVCLGLLLLSSQLALAKLEKPDRLIIDDIVTTLSQSQKRKAEYKEALINNGIESVPSEETQNFRNQIEDQKIGQDSFYLESHVMSTPKPGRVKLLVGPGTQSLGQRHLGFRISMAYELTEAQSKRLNLDRSPLSELAQKNYRSAELDAMSKSMFTAYKTVSENIGDYRLFFEANDRSNATNGVIKLKDGRYYLTHSIVIDLNSERYAVSHAQELSLLLTTFISRLEREALTVQARVLERLARLDAQTLGGYKSSIEDEKAGPRSCRRIF